MKIGSIASLTLSFLVPIISGDSLDATDSSSAEPTSVVLHEPSDREATTMRIPHFRWTQVAIPASALTSDYLIQISSDSEFTQIIDEDRVAAVIQRYVPDRELTVGDYWWRVAVIDSQGTRSRWSAPQRFSVTSPTRVLKIPKSADFDQIQKVLSEAAASESAIVKFEPGDYRLDPGEAEAFLDFSRASSLIIDGGGGTFTFTGYLKFVRLSHCQRVTIRNFKFDLDPLPYTAGHVRSINAREGTFDVEIADGHPLPESHPRFDEDRKGMIVDPSGPRMKTGVRLVFQHAGWERIGKRHYRFAAANPRQMSDLAPGDVYVMDPRIATGFDVDACNEVVFYLLVAHAIANEGFNSHYGNRLSILHCGIRLMPGRFIAANNGGHNHHNARVGPWIEGCTWENTGDDICHVNCLVMGIQQQLAPNVVRLPLNNPYDRIGRTVALDIQSGDKLQFYNREAGRLISERKVVRVTAHEKTLDVTLDDDVGEIAPGRPGVKRTGTGKTVTDASITQVFNASRTCNQFVFRNNMIRNGRRIGVLAKGTGGLIEDNTFEGLGGGAVEFWNAPFEGLGASDYVVRNNRIVNCGRLDREHAAIWTTVFKSGSDRLHRSLLITGNEIREFRGIPMLLCDLRDSLVQNNQIVITKRDAIRSDGSHPIVLRNSENIAQVNNRVESD